MISKVISAAAIAAAAVSLGACSSSETSTLANGLIASASLTDKNDAEAGAKIGQTAGTTFTFTTVDEDTTDVSWNTGPYSGKTRTFELKDTDTVGGYEVAEYGYVKGKDDKDDGVLFVTGVGDAGFALGAMFTEGKSGAAAGATHFGEAPTNIPSSGTVGYAGLNAGVTVNDDDTGDQFAEYYGTSEITANFGTGIVEGTLEASGLDTITFTGQMSQGNAVYAANNADIFYGDASVSANSKLIGGFYNDHASSTAGVYDVQTLGDTPIRAIGGFAARNYAG